MSILIAALIAKREDRTFVLCSVFIAWVVLAPLTAYVNDWMPFSGGGDDESYYRLAETEIGGLEGVVDLSKFRGRMEQPGYPWILHIVSALTGHDLLVYKWFNLFLFIVLALVWYKIGWLLEPQNDKFVRIVFIAVLSIAPLWLYFFIVRKDLPITLAQSWALLITIQMWLAWRPTHLVYFVIAAIILILFRSMLLVQSTLVLLCSYGSLVLFRGGANRLNTLIAFTAAVALFGLFAVVASNPAYMASLGIHTEARVISGETIVETGRIEGAKSVMNRALFPVLYLFTETAGLSPNQWEEGGFNWLRGLLSIPWILFFVPFFLFGMCFVFSKRQSDSPLLNNRDEGLRIFATPWNTVIIFIVSSMCISFIVGDTTRWRVSDLPMMAAVACLGWVRLPLMRYPILLGWTVFVFLSATIFHLIR